MPTMLPPDLEQFLQAEVASGKYSSADEALVAGVRLLCDRERQREELRRELDLGLAAVERGDVVTLEGEGELNAFFDDIVARGHERLAHPRTTRVPFSNRNGLTVIEPVPDSPPIDPNRVRQLVEEGVF